MKQQWGREPDAGTWPSEKPVWVIGVICIALASVLAITYYRYERVWTPLERLYLKTYVATQAAAPLRADGWYTLLTVLTPKGRALALDRDVEPFTTQQGESTFALSARALKLGYRRLEWQRAQYHNAKLHGFLGYWIYQNRTLLDLAKPGLLGGLIVLVVGLVAVTPKERARVKQRREGRRLKGPELVTPAVFNRRTRSDGIAFELRRTSLDRLLGRTPFVRIPRDLEASQFLVMGDSGSAKSSLVRQILQHIERCGDIAIVYDPAKPADYTPYFFNVARGDLILNPFDKRMPYWTPGDELRQGADALTLAMSLFPDRYNEQPFFVKAPRKIFAYLLGFHPTPEELVWWMSHPEEIQRRVAGTEYAAMISPDSPGQRDGVVGSLNLVADAFRALPTEAETTRRWSTLAWAMDPCGWLFFKSAPDTRERLAPLFSLWLDMLVLRAMNRGPSKRRIWFIFDELATLQRLPQLHTAITENRKSNNPIVLCFQGRSQIEARYGRDAEAMMSQPATKIFLCTSEPHAAKWISEAIGEQEIERIRESRSSGQYPQSRKSTSWSLEREIVPLVMPSEITGLERGHGYLKCRNLVVRLSLPKVELPVRGPAYVERPALPAPRAKPKAAAATGANAPTSQAPGEQKLAQSELKQGAEQNIQRRPLGKDRQVFE